MQTTTNLGLNLPEINDFYDIEHQNANMMTLDAVIPTKADYESGTFTPSVSANGTATVTSTIGSYNKVGNLVFFSAKVVLSAESGVVAIRDLPFPVKDSDTYGHLSVLIGSSTTLGGVTNYTNYMASSPSVDTNNFTYLNTGKVFRFFGVYETE